LSLSNCTALGEIPDTPWAGEMLNGERAVTTMLSKKRKRYTKEEWEKMNKNLPYSKQFRVCTTIDGFAENKEWILKTCAKNNWCRDKYLLNEVYEFEKGIGLRK
jgi:hypothetical protein